VKQILGINTAVFCLWQYGAWKMKHERNWDLEVKIFYLCDVLDFLSWLTLDFFFLLL